MLTFDPANVTGVVINCRWLPVLRNKLGNGITAKFQRQRHAVKRVKFARRRAPQAMRRGLMSRTKYSRIRRGEY